jgi:hypothetical protein
MSRLRVLGLVEAAVLAVAAGPAAAAPPLVLPEPVRVAAADERAVAAVTARGLKILDGDGYLVRAFTADGTVERRRRAAGVPDDGMALVEGGLGPGAASWGIGIDDDDGDDDDGGGAGAFDPGEPGMVRRAVRDPALEGTGAPGQALALAVGAGRIWSGGAGGLWRIEVANGGSAVRVIPQAGDGVRAVACDHGGRAVAAVVAGRLLVSRDGGDRFDALAPVAGRARSLAVGAGGDVLLIDAAGIRRGSGGADAPLGSLAVIDLADPLDVVACGAGAVALAGGAVYDLGAGETAAAVATAGPRRLGSAPPGAGRLACTPDGRWLLAAGTGLWTSDDRGRTWSTRSDAPAVAVTSLAATAAAIWVGGSSGLWRLPLREPRRPTAAYAPRRPPPQGFDGPPPSPASWRWWHAVLPRLDLSASWSRLETRRDFRALLLATFTFDGPVWARLRTYPLDVTRRRLREAADAARTTLAGGGDDGADGADERRALERALEDLP